MTKDVLISIRGLQSGTQVDEEPIELMTCGQYYKKNGKQYVMYEEFVEGESKPIKSRIKLEEGKLELSKSGSITVHMCFEEQKTHKTQYHTPYGSLSMGIDTKKMTIEEKEQQIKIFILYALEMNGEFVADCKIAIDIKSKEAGKTE